MTTTALQDRGERAARRFADLSRKPVVIEFAGVAKAGKSSTITHVQTFLRRCGFRVDVVIERASVCPIRDKKHATFNVWTACTTLAKILEHTQVPPRPDDPQILILDRGLFDSICWLTLMEQLARLRSHERQALEQFLLINEWKRRISAVVVMTVSPEEAVRRDRGYLPVEGVTGSIMNQEVLQKMLDLTHATCDRLEKDFQIWKIDTSSGETDNKPERTAEVVAEHILSLIEAEIEEEVLCVSKDAVSNAFGETLTLSAPGTQSLEQLFERDGFFRPRAAAETDGTVVQALPVVVVRNRSGDILRLKRRERDTDNPLHEKVVIWAGGHVRREDSFRGNPIRQAALRELEEELRLSIEEQELCPIGAVYADPGGRTSRHVAIVFEWRAQTDDVAVALSNAEFFEKRGTSLSGRFVSLKELSMDVDTEPYEAWSDLIVREFLAKNLFEFRRRLF